MPIRLSSLNPYVRFRFLTCRDPCIFRFQKSELARVKVSWAMEGFAGVKLKSSFYAILIDHLIQDLRFCNQLLIPNIEHT
jgi:hypothetical protein